jgi:hypothetical protein
MATAKPHRSIRGGPLRQGPRRHRLRGALLAVVALGLILLAVFWRNIHQQGMIAAAYGARVACSCHYIAGRGLKDCRKDFEPGMGLVMLSANAAKHSITARVPLVASQTASFREGEGCLLQPWAP